MYVFHLWSAICSYNMGVLLECMYVLSHLHTCTTHTHTCTAHTQIYAHTSCTHKYICTDTDIHTHGPRTCTHTYVHMNTHNTHSTFACTHQYKHNIMHINWSSCLMYSLCISLSAHSTLMCSMFSLPPSPPLSLQKGGTPVSLAVLPLWPVWAATPP